MKKLLSLVALSLACAGAARADDMTDAEVRKVDKDAGKLTLKHGEITNLQMPPMTMIFGVKDKALLDRVKAEARGDRHPALLKRIELAKNRPAGNAAEFAARIKADAKDFEARFGLAALQAFEGDFNGAFDQLLEVVLRDKGEQRERARKQLVEWFAVCPDAEAVSRGRRYLGMYLN